MPHPCIRIRFVTCDGFVSKAIRWVTNSLFSHVEFGTPDGTWIGAHTGAGVQERPADYCQPSREYVYEIPCSQLVLDLHLNRLRMQIGTKYNNVDILGLLIRSRKFSTPGAVICSQFVSDEMLSIFGAAGYLNVLPGFTHLVTPETAHLSPALVGRRVKKYE